MAILQNLEQHLVQLKKFLDS